MSVNRQKSGLDRLREEAQKEREQNKGTRAYNTNRQASKPAEVGKKSGLDRLREEAQREREERKVTQRQTTPSAAKTNGTKTLPRLMTANNTKTAWAKQYENGMKAVGQNAGTTNKSNAGQMAVQRMKQAQQNQYIDAIKDKQAVADGADWIDSRVASKTAELNQQKTDAKANERKQIIDQNRPSWARTNIAPLSDTEAEARLREIQSQKDKDIQQQREKAIAFLMQDSESETKQEPFRLQDVGSDEYKKRTSDALGFKGNGIDTDSLEGKLDAAQKAYSDALSRRDFEAVNTHEAEVVSIQREIEQRDSGISKVAQYHVMMPYSESDFKSSGDVLMVINALESDRKRLVDGGPKYGAWSAANDDRNKNIKILQEKIDSLTPILEKLQAAETQALIDSGEYRYANSADIIFNSLSKGWNQSKMGVEYNRDMFGLNNDADRYEELLASDRYKYIPKGKFHEAISGTAELLGQMGEGFFNWETQGLGAAGATTAFALGQLGPQAAIPEEVLSMPGMYLKGVRAGMTKRAFEVESGLAYKEMLENGISEATARKLATGVGVANAGLEMLQIDELGKAFKILQKNPATQEFAGAMYTRFLKDYGINLLTETGQEVAQEGVTIAGVQIGSKIDKGEWAYSAEEVADRVVDTGVSAFMSFALLGGASAASGYVFNQSKDYLSNPQVKKAVDDVKSDPEKLTTIIEEGKLFDDSTKAAQTAKKVERDIAEGKEVSDKDVAELIVENSREMVNENADFFVNNDDNLNALIEEGQDIGGKSSKIADDIAYKVSKGEEVTREDVQRLIEANEKVDAAEQQKARADQTAKQVRSETGYGERGLKLFNEEYAKGNDPVTIKTEMDTPYHAGLFGMNPDKVKLDTPFAQQAYKAGEQDRILTKSKESAKAAETSVWGDKAGLIQNDLSKRLPLSKQTVIDEFFGLIGVKGVVRERILTENGGGEANGSLDPATGILEISARSEKPIVTVVSHEGLHWTQVNAPEEYAVVRDFAVSYYAGKISVGDVRKGYRDASGGDVSLDSVMAADEMTAKFVEEIVGGDEATLQKIVNAMRQAIEQEESAAQETTTKSDKPTLRQSLQTLLGKLRELIDKFKSLRNKPSIKNNSIALAEVDSTIDNMERGYKMVEDLFVSTAKSVQSKRDAGKVHTETAQKNTTTDSGGVVRVGGVQYDLEMSFADQVDAALGNTLGENQDVYVSDTPTVLTRMGFTQLPMLITQKHIRDINHEKSKENTKWHGIADTKIKKLPQLIRHPAMILKSATREDSIVIVTTELDLDKLPIVVSVKPDGTGHYNRAEIDSNFITSMYGREGFESWLDTAITEDRVLFNDKKRTQSLLSRTGLYLPNSLNKNGFFESNISHFWEGVKKNQSESSKKNYSLMDSTGTSITDQQAEFFKDSKVVDGKGRLKVMYQGGDGDFTVFDRKKSSYSNLHGRGFYFTDSESHARQYGKVRPFYLNITNPVSTTERTITKPQMRAFLEAVMENEDDFSFENYGEGATVDGVLKSVFSGKSDFAMLNDVSQTAIGDLVAAVELFNEVNGTDFDGFILDTETVTFHSEQAKLTDNENPTKSADVRFSLNTPVEETDRLIALHNVTEEKLLGAIELGGFAMPSIAVTRADMGHTSFGGISVVFGKDTISPTDRRNAIYGGDAYTPTFPSIGYKISDNELTKVRNKISALLDGTDAKHAFYLALDADNVEHSILRNNGSFKEAYRGNEALQIAFLKDKGIPFRPVTKDKSYSRYADNSVLRKIDRALGGRALELANADVDEVMKYEQLVRKLINDYYEASGAGRVYTEKFGFSDVESILRDAGRYMRDGAKKQIDVAETRKRLANKFTKKLAAEYETWLGELGAGVVEKKGVRNDRDMFTPSGNRRSFEQLHFGYSLENIVRAMQGELKQGAQAFIPGSGNLRGASAKSYSSIDEARAEIDRLQSMTHDEKHEKYSAFDDKCYELCKKMTEGKGLGAYAMFDAAEVLTETIAKHKTKDGIYRYLNREYGMVYNVTQDIANEAYELMKEAQKLPTEYFEAKPYRAVGFDEVLAVVAPSNMDKGLKQTLADMGVTVKTYKNGDHDARLKAVNSVNGARFSLKGVRELEDAHKQAEINDLLRKELKGVQKALDEQIEKTEKWKGELKRTKEPTVDKNSVDKLTRKILREYNSDADVSEISAQLKELGDALLRVNTDEGLASAKAKADEIARAIVEDSRETYVDSYLDGIRKVVRGTKIFVPDWVRRGIPDYEHFRRRNFGRMRLNHNDGIPIDVFWNDMNDQFGDVFNEAEVSNSVDQLLKLEEIVESATPLEFNPFVEGGAADEVIDTLGYELMVKLLHDVDPTPPTFADKQYEKRKQAVKEAKAQVRETERERANKRLTEERAKARERLNRLLTEQKQKARERYEKKLEKATSYYREQMANASESRKAMELREKITRHVDKMSRKLRKPTKTQNIPVELHQAVKDVLAAINMESNFEWVVGSDGKRRRVQKGADPNSTPTKRTEAFNRLISEYKKIAAANTYDIALDPNLIGMGEGARDMLQEIVDLYDIPISSMNSAQLTAVWNVLRAVEKTVLDAGKILTNDFMREKYEDRVSLANAFLEEAKTRRKHTTTDRHFTMDYMDPYTYFSQFGQPGLDFFRMLRNAQDDFLVKKNEIADMVNALVSAEKRVELEKDIHEFETQAGEKLVLSKAHIMDMWLLNNRPQGKQHLLGGGIYQPTIKGKVKRGTEPTRLTELDLGKIFTVLTEEDRTFAQDFRKITDKLAEWGDKANVRVYGYEKFGDPNYWSIFSAAENTKRTVEKNPDLARSVGSIGAAKNTVLNANNPVNIYGMFEAFDRHSADMLNFAAWLAPMKDAEQLFNIWLPGNGGELTSGIFKNMLNRVGGAKSDSYWLDLMEDIQNGIKSKTESETGAFVEQAIGKVRKAAIAGNARVVIQQPTALARALVVIDPKYMAKGLVKGVTAGKGTDKARKHSPTAVRKFEGNFDMGTSIRSMAESFYKPESLKGKIVEGAKEAPLWAAGKADELAWGKLWNACEHQIADTRKDLSVGSDEWYAEVRALFDDAIDQTQVVDGILQRSKIMRSSNSMDKWLTAYKGEPLKTVNLVMRSWNNWRYQTDPVKRSAARKKWARALFALSVNAVLNGVAQSLWDGIRDDDDEEKYLKRVWNAFIGLHGDEETWRDYVWGVMTSNLVSGFNPLSMLPGLSDLWSIAEGFDVNRPDAEAFSRVMQEAKNLIGSVGEDGGKQTVGYSAARLLTRVAYLFGSGSSNLLRDIESVVRSIQVETDSFVALYKTEKLKYDVVNNKSKFIGILYNAYAAGDTKAYNAIYNDLIKIGVSDKSIASGMETRMMKAEGVTKASELEERWVSPSKKKQYDKTMSPVKKSSLWKNASAKQQSAAENLARSLANGSNEEAAEKIKVGSAVGLSSDEWVMYQLALDMHDTPNSKGELGTHTAGEKASAILAVDGLSDTEMAYLFDGKYQDGKAYRADEAGLDMGEYLLYRIALDKAAKDLDTTTASTKAKKEALKQFDFTAKEKAYLKKEK